MRNTYSEREKLHTGTLAHQTRYSMSNMMFILVFLMVPLIYCQVVQNEITIKVEQMEKQMTSNQKQINDLSKKLFHIQTNPAWPSGKYCIFQSGSCPPGFTSIHGYMNAVNMYASNQNYLGKAYFGNSKITCHYGCRNQYLGELHLYTCCK